MAKGPLKDSIIVQEFNKHPVCVLPKGFYMDDRRWDLLWRAYDEKGAPLTSADLARLFDNEQR